MSFFDTNIKNWFTNNNESISNTINKDWFSDRIITSPSKEDKNFIGFDGIDWDDTEAIWDSKTYSWDSVDILFTFFTLLSSIFFVALTKKFSDSVNKNWHTKNTNSFFNKNDSSWNDK